MVALHARRVKEVVVVVVASAAAHTISGCCMAAHDVMRLQGSAPKLNTSFAFATEPPPFEERQRAAADRKKLSWEERMEEYREKTEARMLGAEAARAAPLASSFLACVARRRRRRVRFASGAHTSSSCANKRCRARVRAAFENAQRSTRGFAPLKSRAARAASMIQVQSTCRPRSHAGRFRITTQQTLHDRPCLYQ